MKYLFWIILLLIIIPFMVMGVNSGEMTTGVVVREAFLDYRYGIEFTATDKVFFIQITGPGTFAISEVIEAGSMVEVPTDCLNRKATIVHSSNIKIL